MAFGGLHSIKMSSPDLPSHSEDDILTSPMRHETIETVPLARMPDSLHDGSDHDTLATLPLHRGQYTQNNGGLTQPTQLIDRPTSNTSSPPAKPTVQVAASSPTPTPTSVRKPSSILASAMAPAGTTFRRPIAPQPAKPRTYNDDGPTYIGSSSDEEQPGRKKNDIKTSTFIKNAEKVPESPQSGSRFAGFAYKPVSHTGGVAVKRTADVLANAYGNSSKRQRQTGPSRAVPVTQQPDIDFDDIGDFNLRTKVKRMHAIHSGETVRACRDALVAKKGNYDDASEYLLQQAETQDSSSRAIDLTGSDDELMPTPAGTKTKNMNDVRQQAKKPAMSIAEKYGTQAQEKKYVPKQLKIFDAPAKPEPSKKFSRLVRGKKNRSPSPTSGSGASAVRAVAKQQPQVIDSDSEAADSGIHSGPEDAGFDLRLLKFFNQCTAAELADTAGITHEVAEHVVSKRPFSNMSKVEKVEAANVKPSKSRRKADPLGVKVVEKVATMITSYEAVDYLVRKCEDMARPLASEMKKWGINIYGSKDGELDMVSLHDSQRSNHDSGIGTPVSDDDRDGTRAPGGRRFLGQPSIMADGVKMKDYQVVGVNWLSLLYRQRLSCILADDMGLGKTMQVIGFLAHLLEIGERGPHLVVVPAATLENWLKEFARFCPTLHVEPYYANQAERFAMREDFEDRRDEINVVVTTYTLAKGPEDNPWLRKFGFTCTIFDEGHVLKNADSQVSMRLSRIESKFRLLLTGTPLQNNLKELISLLAFLMPRMFNERKEDLSSIFTHNVKAMDANHEALLSAERIARARTMLTPFILRRKKYQVLKELPKKDRRVEYCDMTPEQLEFYQKWLDKAYSVRDRRAKGENVGNESANILMKLRQAAIHPMLFRRLYKDADLPKIAKQCLKSDLWRESNPDLIVTELRAYSDFEIHHLCDTNPVLHKFCLNNHEWLASGKIRKLVELLKAFTAEGHRTLIFSQFVMVLDILELVLEREAIAYFRLDGTTKVSERQDLIDEFCDDSNTTPVFMLSTKAGGAGINLAKANKVIVFDSGFNPQDDIQAENRAHRIGQTKDVEVIRLVTKGTVEEQIYAMGLTKLKLDEQVAGEGGEDVPKKEGEETEKEAEGRNLVEEMFFKKLETEPEEKVLAEIRQEKTVKQVDDSVKKGVDLLASSQMDSEADVNSSQKSSTGRKIKTESMDLPDRPRATRRTSKRK